MPVNIPKDQFLRMIPSSRANQTKPSTTEIKGFTITVQRKTRSGRWAEVASWDVATNELDMQGPLAMGLKDNYRIIVQETVDDEGRASDLVQEEGTGVSAPGRSGERGSVDGE
jgi:hypothetical protein